MKFRVREVADKDQGGQLDPRWDNMKGGGSVGGIHHTNVTIQQAMQRYVIQRYRGKEKNLKILGYRPVSHLAKALNQPSIAGEGIDFRVRYEMGRPDGG